MMNRYFWGVLLLGCLLRLIFAFSQSPADAIHSGGDTLWYLGNGLALFQAEPNGVVYENFRYAANALPIPPLYLIATGAPQLVLSIENTVRLLWLLQSILGITTAYLAARIAWKLSNDKRVGYFVGTVLALSPVMIFEPASIVTETFYLFFIVLGLWLYLEWIALRFEQVSYWQVLLVGIIWGLASLTRATSILFPLGLAGHLIFILAWKKWQRGLLLAFILVFSYGAVISTWTVYNWVKYERFIILSDQFGGAFWRGAVNSDGSPQENDAQLDGRPPEVVATEAIASDPRGFVQRRVDDLLNAYLQPHGTLTFGVESLKAMAVDWVNQGFAFDGLLRLLSGEGFWAKLVIYILHYGAILGSIASLWVLRQRWKLSLVLWGFILYTSLLHLVLLALPRYIFPTYPIFWILAGSSFIALWDKIKPLVPNQEKGLNQAESSIA